MYYSNLVGIVVPLVGKEKKKKKKEKKKKKKKEKRKKKKEKKKHLGGGGINIRVGIILLGRRKKQNIFI